LSPELRDVVITGENRDYIGVLGIASTPEIVDDNAAKAGLRDKLMRLQADASASAQRVLRFAFLTERLSIDHGELTDKGVISQSSILRRDAALVEKLYANNPADHVICLDPAPGTGLAAVVDSAGERSGPAQLDFRGLDSFRL
jgi:feruloyl-CoA synthase